MKNSIPTSTEEEAEGGPQTRMKMAKEKTSAAGRN